MIASPLGKGGGAEWPWYEIASCFAREAAEN